MDFPEKHVFEQFRAGNIEAFSCIFKSYYNYLVRYAVQIVKDVNIAEDIVENTMMNLWLNRHKLSVENSLKGYLFKTVYHNCINHIKHFNVSQKHILYLKHHIHTDYSGNPDYNNFPLSQLINKEIETRLNAAIDRLPKQCREIFILSRFENLKNDEIAKMLKISVNTVKTQLLRALRKIREDMKDFLPAVFWIFALM